MPVIELSTVIHAPRERVFDLARCIEAHQDSTGDTRERAIAGIVTGLIGFGEGVTWEAYHFGVKQRLTSRITQFERPAFFQDAMVSGPFKRLVHDHTFEEHPQGVLIEDRFDYTSPFGPLGVIADTLFLTSYLRRFLAHRNGVLKRIAESDEWRRYLEHG